MKEESVENQNPSPDNAAAAPSAAPAAETATAAGQPAGQESGQPADSTPSADDQLAAAQKLAAENYERFMRVSADFENFRRRTLREKEELRQFAANKVLEDLLPVLDNLGLGLAAAKAPNATLETLVGGIVMVGDQLKSALAQHGLVEINPAGAPFDPNLHEALSQLASPDVAEGHVIQVVRVGYTLNGRLLRAASVVVSSGPSANA